MALTPGMSLGVYRVGDLLGKGGMGEVYRARDEKLGRDVALKVLPDEFASDPDRFARFEREARLLASLNHPNIAGIHGIESSGATQFLILELVEGETLAERMRRPLSIEQSLRLSLQIATALEIAHARGIVHRDLKPANIKVAPDGTVKVLDFGLARVSEPCLTDVDVSHSPTMSISAATARGVILGTAGYMAPEQARGEVATKQADIWAFGCILFEMLSGRQIWPGRRVTDVIASIVAREPDWSRLPPDLHPRVRYALERCLEKDPADRYHDIADVRLEITKALTAPDAAALSPSRMREKRRSTARWLVAAALALVVAAAGAGLAGWFLKPAPEHHVARFDAAVPEVQPEAGVPPFPVLAISNDGTRWAISTIRHLYVRNVSEAEPRPIQGVESQVIFSPTFSPDGNWLAYVDVPAAPSLNGAAIKKVPVTGGTAQTIVSLENLTSVGAVFTADARWDERDMLTWIGPDGIMQIPSNGGKSELIVKAGKGEIFGSPVVLPGGKAILFTATTAVGIDRWDAGQIAVQALGSNERTVLWRGGRDARYLPSGHLAFVQGTTLFALPFDLAQLKVTGSQVPLLEGVPRPAIGLASDSAQFAISADGSLVFLSSGAFVNNPANSPAPRSLVWVDRQGHETPIPQVRSDDWTMARISPDGSKVALVVGNVFVRNSNTDIWLYDIPGGTLKQITFNTGDDDAPVWTSDSKRIYFRSFPAGEEGRSGIFSMSADGGPATPVAIDKDFPTAMPWALSPDGRTLTLVNGHSATDLDLATPDVAGQSGFHTLLKAGRILAEPAISPNGQWIAYYDLNGPPPPEISIRSFPDVDRPRYPIARGGLAIFSHDGSELFFYDGQGLSVVSLTYGATLGVGPPRQLFRGQYWYGVGGANGTLGRAWDVDPKHDRFLMVQMPGAATPTGAVKPPQPVRVNVVLNWLDEVKARTLAH